MTATTKMSIFSRKNKRQGEKIFIQGRNDRERQGVGGKPGPSRARAVKRQNFFYLCVLTPSASLLKIFYFLVVVFLLIKSLFNFIYCYTLTPGQAHALCVRARVIGGGKCPHKKRAFLQKGYILCDFVIIFTITAQNCDYLHKSVL